ncbi:hypothetical protein MXE28_09460 [Veillonella sp. KGMB01456]|uniref:hypothetical protein n=1 Tax=Veillonella sp. KGMB01456 TaxID=2934794 RepID=UPI001FF58CB4|nr:hypothetical protein [Veillonella sp. KGMB01456]MCK0529583.1 hypothetical protein [Veillonella sp. KGMB01456]DAH82844.1 MAG TPA: hypothetical protein [Caudoviricetes sp.]
MIIKELLNRAFMQIDDTGHESYTPYKLLEYYNEGNHLLNHLLASVFPSYVKESYTVTGTGKVELPTNCIAVLKVTADGQEIDDYTVNQLKNIAFDADAEQVIEVEYVPTVDYVNLDDDSGYIAEIETMLVDYIVYRVMQMDASGLVAMWQARLSELASQSGGSTDVVMARGYYDYGGQRTDYGD